MPRKMTWVILIWTGLFIWVLSSAGSASNCGADEACQAGTAVGVGLGAVILFPIWLIGFLILSVIWFMSRPAAPNVTVYGPQGQSVLLREGEARKRVEQPGWSYVPPAARPPRGTP